jgi:pimeloyl-ACP methyl ester carboxylesterase
MHEHHHFARVGSVELHWTELGITDSKPPLVLLHGLSDCQRTWRDLGPMLAQDRRVMMPDLPGHGLSARPDASYELGWYARTMAQWLGLVGVASVDVVGHSFGGGVAQMMLLQSPRRIRRLVLASSGGLGREIAFSLRLGGLARIIERFGQPFMGPATWLALKTNHDVVSEDDVRRLIKMNTQQGSARALARTLGDLVDWRGQRRTFFEGAHELTDLPPIAVLWGTLDPKIPFSQAKRFAQRVDGVHLTAFDGCGHFLHHERPQAFARTVRDFLDDAWVRPARLHDGRGRPRRGA